MTGPELVMIVRMLVSLVVVAGLAVVLLRFGLPKLGALGGATARLETVEVRALDRQHKIALVRARGEEILLGLGAGEVTLLRAWREPQDTAAEDTAAEDTAAEDTAAEDTAAEDTAEEVTLGREVA